MFRNKRPWDQILLYSEALVTLNVFSLNFSIEISTLQRCTLVPDSTEQRAVETGCLFPITLCLQSSLSCSYAGKVGSHPSFVPFLLYARPFTESIQFTNLVGNRTMHRTRRKFFCGTELFSCHWTIPQKTHLGTETKASPPYLLNPVRIYFCYVTKW